MRETPSDLKILPAGPNDVALILNFIRKLAEYERLTDQVVADEETLREFLFGDRPAAEVILAFLTGRPVGFAVFFTTFSTFVGRPGLYLEDLFVDAEFRGLGIGKALLRHLAKFAVGRGYDRLEWSVLDWNKPSIDFYQSLGAKPFDNWILYRLTGSGLQALAGGDNVVR